MAAVLGLQVSGGPGQVLSVSTDVHNAFPGAVFLLHLPHLVRRLGGCLCLQRFSSSQQLSQATVRTTVMQPSRSVLILDTRQYTEQTSLQEGRKR